MKDPFEKYQFHGFLYDALKKMRIKQPTLIQQNAIPAIMQGKDVIGQSQTGTGKTLAFLLPILQRIHTPRKVVQAVILAPSRELSNQIAATIQQLSLGSEIDVLLIQGGVDINRQIQRLRSNPHIIVGTPGRVLDLINQNKLAAHTAKCLVIDEADTMLEMGFREDIDGIVSKMKRNIQFLLFSATLPPKVVSMAKSFMKGPCYFEINPEQVAAIGIEHVYFKVTKENKDDTLVQLVRLYNPYLAIVFVRKKEQVEGLVTKLHQAGFEAEGLHGDLEQAKRKQVMRRFREAKIQVMVATDLASRGLDVEGITHVFNYDLPINTDQYVHRTGRTARAAETGLAVNLIKTEEEPKLRQIAHKLGQMFMEKGIDRDNIIDKPAKSKVQPPSSARAKHKAKVTTDKFKSADKSKSKDKFKSADEQPRTAAKQTKIAAAKQTKPAAKPIAKGAKPTPTPIANGAKHKSKPKGGKPTAKAAPKPAKAGARAKRT